MESIEEVPACTVEDEVELAATSQEVEAAVEETTPLADIEVAQEDISSPTPVEEIPAP
jgi:hypothetical protein